MAGPQPSRIHCVHNALTAGLHCAPNVGGEGAQIRISAVIEIDVCSTRWSLANEH